MRFLLYANIVASFAVAGVLDLRAGEHKLGVVALLFGVVNGVIFFWRSP